MQMKPTSRYHLTLVGAATVKHSTKVKCCLRCGGKGTLLLCCSKHKLVAATVEDSVLVISNVHSGKGSKL